MGKIPDIPESLIKCICGGCPSFDTCMQDKVEGLYCARGKSVCEITKKGCICRACPLAAENNLEEEYYCLLGAEE